MMSRVDLLEIAGLHTAAKDRPNSFGELLGGGHADKFLGLTLQICQPTIVVRQIIALAHAEAVRSRVSKRSHMLHKTPVDLFFRFPAWSVHYVEPQAVWFDPFVFDSEKLLSSWYSEARLSMIFLRALSGTGVRQYTYKS